MRYEFVQRHGGMGGAFYFFGRAFIKHVKLTVNFFCLFFYFYRADEFMKSGKVAHFDVLYMVAESGRLEGEIGIDVEHAVVIMAEYSHPVLRHGYGYLYGIYPVVD